MHVGIILYEVGQQDSMRLSNFWSYIEFLTLKLQDIFEK